MPANNPRAPTRKEFQKIFGNDKRLIKAFEQLFELIPDEIDSSIEELFEGQFSWLGPAVNAAKAKAFEQGKEIRDIVEEISTDRINIARVSGNLGEFKKVVADQAAFIAELMATVARLNGKIGEATKARPFRFESSAFQMLDNDAGLVGDASSANFDVTMPDPTKNTGKTYLVQSAGGSGSVTAVAFSSELFGGDTDLTVPSAFPFNCAALTSDGTDWIIR